MKKIILATDAYYGNFKTFGNVFFQRHPKTITWLCFSLFLVVIYAFIFNAIVGFAFKL
ncbi:MAG: DUF6747 family protein [Cellulophaga sp.]